MANNLFNGLVNSNWGTAGNWSLLAVPVAGDGNVAYFDNTSPNCTVNTSARSCTGINFNGGTGYTNTITMSQNITVTGTLGITLGASMGISGSGTLIVNGTMTLTSNGKTWSTLVNFTGTATNTLADAWTISAGLTIGSSGTTTLTGQSINVTAGNLSVSGSPAVGTTTITLSGVNQTWSNTSANPLKNPLTINMSGTLTLSSTPQFGSSTFTYTAGTISGSIQFGASLTTTVNINASTFSPTTLTVGGGGGTGQVNFAGTNGWSVSTFTCTTAGQTVQLKSTLTYLISTTMTVTGTAASPVTIQASTGGSQAILTLATSATLQADVFCNATDIDSSLGQTIWSFGATLSNTLNWNALVAPGTISSGFVGTLV